MVEIDGIAAWRTLICLFRYSIAMCWFGVLGSLHVDTSVLGFCFGYFHSPEVSAALLNPGNFVS